MSESQMLRQCELVLKNALPSNWNLNTIYEQERKSRRIDALFIVTSPRGEQVTYVVEAKLQLTTKNILSAVQQLYGYLADGSGKERALIATRYLSPRSRQVLKDREVSYVDATGNVRLLAELPGLFIELQGASKDPWPDDIPLRSLRGRGAGRAMRALIDTEPPFGVRELGIKTNVSPATLSRVIDLLERDALIDRDSQGGVMKVDWMGAIRRWSQDYELRLSNTVSMFLDPRGINSLLKNLSQTKLRYSITSSLATKWFAPIAPTRMAAIYVENSNEFARELGLRIVDSGANVALIEPYDEVVFERTMVFDDLVISAPSQVAVDLMTGPGREPSEGEELLLWMKGNLGAWQS